MSKATYHIFDRDDFRSQDDGYHLDSFDNLLISLGVNKKSAREKVNRIEIQCEILSAYNDMGDRISNGQGYVK